MDSKSNYLYAFAYRKIIVDKEGKPTDYEFIEVNKAFERLVTSNELTMIGKSRRDIIPDNATNPFDWISFYGEVALSGKAASIEQYSEVLDRWYDVEVYSQEKGYFATIFIDITSFKQKELELIDKNKQLGQLYKEIASTQEELRQQMAELDQTNKLLMESEEELRQQFDEINSNKATIELSEERYKTLVNNSQDSIFSCDCEGGFTTVNSRFCEVLELPIDKIIGKTMEDFYQEPEDIEKWNALFPNVITGGKVVSLEYKSVRNDGRVGYFEVTLSPIFDLNKRVVGVLGTNHDITTRKENEQTINHMAYYDLISDLPNRIHFLDQLETSISKATKNGTKVMIVFLDLDNFKTVNDTLGQAAGDELLVETSKRLITCIDGNNTVARLGRDEFSFLIDDVKQQESIVVLLEKVKLSFAKPFRINNRTINQTASIGVSMFPEDGDTAEEIMRSADTAMYKAKGMGKNNYQFFNIRMKEDLLRKTNISGLLSNAIENNEFVLHYQPQYAVETGELRGFEALLRWNSPEMGFLSPMEFIPIAEETGMIIQIGEWVLNTACRICKKYETIYECDLIMAVNISPIQLRQKNFGKMVIKALKATGLKSRSLELEVTEGIFIDSYDSIVEELKVLEEIGVKTALDDFGTGYSCLSYLKKLPINLLKIDKAFVQEIDFLNLENELTESIITLASKLNIKTIAEGVETLDQFNYLVSAKCDYIQGYFLGKPGPEDLIGGIIERGSLNEFLDPL